MNANVHVASFPSPETLAEAVARQWLETVAAASRSGGPFTVALSGGRITTKFFESVVAQNQALGVPFDHVHFFWADERCVPPTDQESNYRLAGELLFAPLNIGPGQIHRVKGEGDPRSAAREASAELSRLAPLDANGQPVLDLVLLGMGEDGHVASLFPGAGENIVKCFTPFLVVHNSPKPPPTRISLSYGTIAAARQTWVLASGAGKEKALHDSLVSAILNPLSLVMSMRTGDKTTQIFTDLPIPKKFINF